MQRISLLLLGMASLVASGVIMDRGHIGLNSMTGLGLQTVQGIRGGFGAGGGGVGSGNVMSRDELLRQKFVLDILQQVHLPLQQQDFLNLDDNTNTITSENLYMRPLTQEMLTVLDLISNNQMLGKHTICNMNNKNHIQQIVGLHRLLVTARDFDAFKRLAVYARQNVNTEIFVNCLVLALGARPDTQMLIVPALHEILPQLYLKDSTIDQVQYLAAGATSDRPQLIDVMGMGQRNWPLNSRIVGQHQGGLLGVLNRSPLLTPWREFHKQIALRKMMEGNVVQQDASQMDKLVVSLPGNGLLSQDLGLKSYVTLLIGELLVNQDEVGNSIQNLEGGINDHIMQGGRGQIGLGHILNGMRRNRVDNDLNMNSQYGNILGGRRYNTVQGGVNSFGGRSQYSDWDINEDTNDNIYGGMGQDIGMESNIYMGHRGVQQGQPGINTVSVNDARLLFVGRRNRNPYSVVNMGHSNYDEDDLISGGRHVSNERNTGKYQYPRNKYSYNNNDDENNDDYDQYTNANGGAGIMMMENDNEDYDLWSNKNRGSSGQHQQIYDNGNDDVWGPASSMGTGYGRNDFLNAITRGQRHFSYAGQGLQGNSNWGRQYNGESLDKYLPTTSINNERLLHVNRRKLNTVQGVGHFNGMTGDIDDENDFYGTGYQRGSGINSQNSYFDEQDNLQQGNWDAIRYGNMNAGRSGRQGIYSDNRRNENHGHRHRRSIVNQNVGQSNSVNGRLVLHTLQQLVARLNVERIALGQPQLIANTQSNHVQGLVAGGVNSIQGVDAQTVNKIENIIQNIDQVLQQQIDQNSGASYSQKVNEIGLMLAGQIEDLGLIDILGEIIQQTNQQQQQHHHQQAGKGKITNLLENEAAQILLAGIVQVVDNKIQQVVQQHRQYISNVQSVNIHNVEVDNLQTYLEQADIDLSNLLNDNINIAEQTAQDNSNNNKVVVGRVPRLNHKSFHIKIDVTSDRPQQVVVRNLLVPKVDGQNNILPLAEQRQNTIVLDIATVHLQQGRNKLQINSNEISLTSRDTTPLTKIYQIVMRALNGDTVLPQNRLAGQTTLLPHHLLLPRGRTNGLPMHLITVITPLQNGVGATLMGEYQSGTTGLNALSQDNLPLNYPLHCDITDLDKVIAMPNLMVKDVNIYHDDSIQTPSRNMY